MNKKKLKIAHNSTIVRKLGSQRFGSPPGYPCVECYALAHDPGPTCMLFYSLDVECPASRLSGKNYSFGLPKYNNYEIDEYAYGGIK